LNKKPNLVRIRNGVYVLFLSVGKRTDIKEQMSRCINRTGKLIRLKEKIIKFVSLKAGIALEIR
jgi:hypothetical protein